MSSKQSSKNTQKSQVTSGVDSRIDPYLQNIAGQTNAALAGLDRSHLQGRAVSGRNQYDDMGIAEMTRVLQGNTVDPGTFTNIARDAASGRLLDPATNPYLEGNITATTRPLMEDLTQKILPGLDLGAISQNAFGGDRAGIASGEAIGRTQTAVGDIRAKMLSDNYNRERAYQWDSPNQFMAGMGAELSPANMLQQLGGYERGLQDLDIQNEIATRAYNNDQDFAGLERATNIQNAIAGNYGTQNSSGESTQTTKTTPNALMEIAKVGIGAASAASGMGWNPFGGGGGGPTPPSFSTMGAPTSPGFGGVTPQMLGPQAQPIYVPGVGMVKPGQAPMFNYSGGGR